LLIQLRDRQAAAADAELVEAAAGQGDVHVLGAIAPAAAVQLDRALADAQVRQHLRIAAGDKPVAGARRVAGLAQEIQAGMIAAVPFHFARGGRGGGNGLAARPAVEQRKALAPLEVEVVAADGQSGAHAGGGYAKAGDGDENEFVHGRLLEFGRSAVRAQIVDAA